VDHWKAIELARHYVLLERGGPALEVLEHASPELAESWLWRANALHQLQRYEDAIEAARRGIAIDAESSHLWHAIARAELSSGRLPAAKEAIDESLRLIPDDPQALALQAAILTQQGERRAASQVIGRAAALAPEMRAVRAMRAMLTPVDDEAAVRMSRELLEAEPEGAFEHWWHATNLIRRGRLRDAADHLSRAVALDPDNETFVRTARMARHWFFWPLRITSPVLYWLAWYSIFPLWLFGMEFGGVVWTAMWCAVAWSVYALIFLLTYRLAQRR